MPTHQYVQIPPDGSGKKIFHRLGVVIEYENGLHDFTEGDSVIGAISGLSGTIIQIEGITDNGQILVMVNVDNEQETTIDGEDLNVEGVKFAEANGTGTSYFLGSNIITGANSILNGAYVDNRGQLYTRHAAGVPNYDLAGNTSVAQRLTVGRHVLTGVGTKDVTTISETVSGSATCTLNNTIPAEVLSCPASPGQAIQRRTDVYHKYITGTSTTSTILCYMGDSGIENVTRRWGIYDDDNGFFFELDGQTLYAVVRSSTTGSAVNTKIAQSNWNKDQIDGNGGEFNLSGITLDLTKTNAFWVSYRGSIVCSFGIFNGSEKITCHEHTYTNNYSRKMITSLILPVTWEQFTDSTATPVSISEMYFIGETVAAGTDDFEFARTTQGYLVENATIPADTTAADIWTPVISVRCGSNRKWIFPNEVHAFSNINLIGRIRVSSDAALIGSSWFSVGSAEVDVSAVTLLAGTEFGSSFVAAGSNTVQEIVSPLEIGPLATKLIRRADITDTPFHMTLEFKAMKEQPAGWVHVSFVWLEV